MLDATKDFAAWVFAVIKVWYGWLPSSALAAAIGYGQNIGWLHPGRRVYLVILTCGMIFSMFVAWRKERVENRKGPQVFMEWDSSQPWGQDVLRFRNGSSSSAFLVEVGDFSWPELSWHRPIKIQSLHTGDKEVRVNAEFAERRGEHDILIGHLHRTLRSAKYQNRDTLSIDVTFSDANRTKFSRTFFLHANSGGQFGSGVMVEMGKLKMRRG